MKERTGPGGQFESKTTSRGGTIKENKEGPNVQKARQRKQGEFLIIFEFLTIAIVYFLSLVSGKEG